MIKWTIKSNSRQLSDKCKKLVKLTDVIQNVFSIEFRQMLFFCITYPWTFQNLSNLKQLFKFCEREKLKVFSIDQFFFVHLNFPNLNFESSILLRFLQSSQYAQKTKPNQFHQKTFLLEKPLLFFQVGENKKKSSKIKVWMQWYETNHSLKQKAGQPDHCRHVPKAGLATHTGLIWKVGGVN